MTPAEMWGEEDSPEFKAAMTDATMRTIMAHVHAIGQSLSEEDWTPMTPSTTLRHAATYLAAINVKLRPEDLAYVVDFLNVYADQLEGPE